MALLSHAEDCLFYYQQCAFSYHQGQFSSYAYKDSALTGFYGINDSGDISGNTFEGGLYKHGDSVTLLNYPGALTTQVLGINNNSQIVGSYQTRQDYPTFH